MASKNYIVFIILVVSISLIFLTGCHSNYVSLSTDIKSEGLWNNAKTKFVFVAQTKAYQSAKGISAFPDGGQSIILLKKTQLYVYDTLSNKLSISAELTGQLGIQYFVRKIFFIDSLVYFEHFKVNINTGKVAKTDTTLFLSHKGKGMNNERISTFNLKKKIDKAPIADWGLTLQKIYPKSDKAYFKDFIRGGSRITSKAIIEQIIATKNKEEIKEILQKMKDHENNLDGYEKTAYGYYREKSYKNLEVLLAK